MEKYVIGAAAPHSHSNVRMKTTNSVKRIIRGAYGFRSMDNIIAMAISSYFAVQPRFLGWRFYYTYA